MDAEKLLELEKKEIDLIVGRGVSFEIEKTIYKRKKGIFGRLKKRVKFTEKVKYTIQEPTLSTLDRITAEQIELPIDENILSSDMGIAEAKKMVHTHGYRMARIIALAVLGQDYVIPVQHGSITRYKCDDKSLNELTELFFRSIKPSKLVQLTLLVNTISNLGDFTNSIRLMSANRTTMPILIEENKKA